MTPNEHIWTGKDVEAENDRAELSRLRGRRPKSAVAMSLVCLAEKHDECRRTICACWCHGGVREPRADQPTPVSGSGRQETP